MLTGISAGVALVTVVGAIFTWYHSYKKNIFAERKPPQSDIASYNLNSLQRIHVLLVTLLAAVSCAWFLTALLAR